MNEDRFWQLIDDAHKKIKGEDADAQVELLSEELEKLSPDEIRAFNAILLSKFTQSYRWDLWAVAYIINGGCSDDGFDYFRGWLIAQGRKVYEAAMVNPESVGEVAEVGGYHECETMFSVAFEAYHRKTDEDMPDDPDFAFSTEPDGEQWEEENLRSLYPKLCEKFGM